MSKCRHDKIASIYGDRIIAASYNRSECLQCGTLFPEMAETRASVNADDARLAALTADRDALRALVREARDVIAMIPRSKNLLGGLLSRIDAALREGG